MTLQKKGYRTPLFPAVRGDGCPSCGSHTINHNSWCTIHIQNDKPKEIPKCPYCGSYNCHYMRRGSGLLHQ